jgi:DNA polymerase-3 subunit beta
MLLLEIKRNNFLHLIQTIIGIVEKRQTQPILSNLLIEFHENTLSILASDQEIQIRAEHTLEKPFTDFAITVAAKKLFDILRAMPEQSDITLESQDHQLQLRAKKTRFQLQTLPAIDFPVIETPQESPIVVHLKQGELKKLITQVQYGMAQQDIRYYLNGMFFVLADTKISAVSTDGHRLCWARLDTGESQSAQELIVPRKTIVELVKLLADNDAEVEISIYTNQIKFVLNQIQIISKLINGKFPDYQRVIPVNHPNIMLVNRLVLLQAIQRVAILSNEKFRGARFVLVQNELKIICNNNEQEEAQEELEVDYHGAPLDIGFNVTYILDALNQIESETVQCHFGDANSSMLMTIPLNEDYKYVIMPMRI